MLQAKNQYEKVGEATETALTVLVEKLNPHGINKSGLRPKELGTVCNTEIQVGGLQKLGIFKKLCFNLEGFKVENSRF